MIPRQPDPEPYTHGEIHGSTIVVWAITAAAVLIAWLCGVR
jgi:hypothetical protein